MESPEHKENKPLYMITQETLINQLEQPYDMPELVYFLKNVTIEEHPWQKYYPKFPRKTQKLFSKCTLQQCQSFRGASKNQWNNESRSVNRETQLRRTKHDSSDIPSRPYAFYSVISKGEKEDYLVLTPVFNEVVAEDRFDLRLVILNKNATDTLNRGRIDLKDYHISDILCITKLQRLENLKGLLINGLKEKDVSAPDGKNFWEVSEFSALPRDIMRNVVTTPFSKLPRSNGGGFQCVASKFEQVVNMERKVAPKGTKVDSLLMTTVLIPLIKPGQFLPYLEEKNHHNVMKRSLKPLKMEELSPIAIKADSAPVYVKTMFGKNTEAFHEYTREAAYQALRMVIEHGSFGIYAIRNLKTDTVPYTSKIDSYNIKHPYVYFEFLLVGEKVSPSLDKWNRSTRIVIDHEADQIAADILTSTKKGELTIHVKARSFARPGDEILFKSMKNKSLIIRQKMEIKPKDVKYNVPNDSKADKLIQALYGGRLLNLPDVKTIEPIRFGSFVLLDTQTKYAQLMADEETIALVGSSSFGCGKTATISAAALHCSNIDPGSFQMVTAVTNCAVVAIVEKLQQLVPSAKIVRIISSENMAEIQPDLLTEYDYPKMLTKLIEEELSNENEHKDYFIKYMISYLKDNKKLTKKLLKSPRLQHLYESADKYDETELLKFFMKKKRPYIIVGTVQSIINAFFGPWKKYADDVSTIQIDESSTLGRETLLHIAIGFPNARYSLVGDHRQLAPFCEREASPLLRNSSVGNVLEDCIKKNFPSVFFNGVFRCRPEITELLGELFYDSSLVSFHRKAETEEQLRRFPLQKIQDFPLIFVDTEGSHQKECGTSLKNPEEARMAMKLADKLSKFVDKSNIAILCFYKGQLNEFYQWSQKSGIYVGSVDSGQGREWPICIICTTRTSPITKCGFMIENRRVNVALSRSRHLNFVFGRKSGMDKAKNWKKIIGKCEEKGTVIKGKDFEHVMKKGSRTSRR